MDADSRRRRSEFVTRAREFLSSLTTLDNSLLSTFTNAVNAFNAEDWPAVYALLDDNVVLTTVDEPKTIRGKDQVTRYLENKIATDHPALSPIEVNADATTGVVQGKAFWDDDDNGKRTRRIITYKFVFNWHANEQRWYLLNLWGSPD